MPSDSARHPTIGQLFAAATVLGLVFGGQHYLAMRMVERPDYHTVGHALKASMPPWYLWAALGPSVIWFIERVRFTRQRWLGPLLLHLGFGSAVIAIHGLVTGAIYRLVDFPNDGHPPVGQAAVMILEGLLGDLPFSLSRYGAVAGFFLAYDHYQRYRDRELTSSRLAKELAETRLAGLRMQLGPHFLFNAMNTIAMLIRRNRPDDAVRTVAGLSELLRAFLTDAGAEDTSLGEEVETVRKYLDIEQIRFEDRLEVRYQVSADAARVVVPRLILQPVVENAVRHGIAARASAGAIVIAATVIGSTAIITVDDDGPGPPDGNPSRGMGLRNVEARLTSRFGALATVTLSTMATGGARTELRIPIEPVQ